MKRKTDRRAWGIVFLVIILFSLAGILISLRLYLNTFRAFTSVTLVARIDCKEKAKGRDAFVEVRIIVDEREEEVRQYPFAAPEWVIEGRIIKWSRTLNALGLKTYYRLDRISGRYPDVARETSMPRLAYDLYGKPDRLWHVIYRCRRFLPFVDAVYGSSAFVPFEAGKSFHVYVTHTGFMIKDVSLPRKRSWWNIGAILRLSEPRA